MFGCGDWLFVGDFGIGVGVVGVVWWVWLLLFCWFYFVVVFDRLEGVVVYGCFVGVGS